MINLAFKSVLQPLGKKVMFLQLFGQPEWEQFSKYIKTTNPFLRAGQMEKLSENWRIKTQHQLHSNIEIDTIFVKLHFQRKMLNLKMLIKYFMVFLFPFQYYLVLKCLLKIVIKKMKIVCEIT